MVVLRQRENEGPSELYDFVTPSLTTRPSMHSSSLKNMFNSLAAGAMPTRCQVCVMRAARTYATASTQGTSSKRMAFAPKKVRRRFVDDMSSDSFLAMVKEDPPEPIVIAPKNPILKQPRTVIDMLLDDPEVDRCVVDLEVGRYDQPGGFEQVQLPLAAYLHWLRGGHENGLMNGRQVYLAQWRGLEEMPSLRRFLDPPRFLQNLIKEEVADLYQASFFVGPNAAVTPLHHDPYINLFRLASTSGPEAAKHFLILPPTQSINQAVRPAAGQGQANTSPLDFQLSGIQGVRDDAILVQMTENSPGQSALPEIKDVAYGVSLKAGELLLLPHRWWHRVENIGATTSWTAGVGYWFRLRDTK